MTRQNEIHLQQRKVLQFNKGTKDKKKVRRTAHSSRIKEKCQKIKMNQMIILSV